MRSRWLVSVVVVALAGCTTAQPSPSSRASASRTTSPTPAPSVATTIDHNVVYVARLGLPPLAKHVAVAAAASASDRIVARFTALRAYTATGPGEVNQYAVAKISPQQVKVNGAQLDLDFKVSGNDWGVSGAAAKALVQQVVYTATEEPGVVRVSITQNLGGPAVVAPDLTLTEPVSRDDVAGYRYAQPDLLVFSGDATALTLTQRFSVEEVAPAMARLMIDTGRRGTGPGSSAPAFKATVLRNDETKQPAMGKWTFSIEIPNATASNDGLKELESGHSIAAVDRTPLRAVHLWRVGTGVRYDLALDDLRPWRVSLLFDPVRIVVDVGGDPRALARSTAVYLPTVGNAVSHAFTLAGAANAFEANVPWRMRDAGGNIVVNGTLRASIGTSAAWGIFDQMITVPASVSGNVTLEVFLLNQRDGIETDSIKIPLSVR